MAIMRNKKFFTRFNLPGFIIFCCTCALLLIDRLATGHSIDTYNNVQVYYNSIFFTNSYGRHFAADGYYYGQKWQCVEFIKRYYYLSKHHVMPDVYGNAKDFFNDTLTQGAINTRRGLYQYHNENNEPPSKDDILVFNDTKYGHIAIISNVTDSSVEIVQQNIFGKPRDILSCVKKDSIWIVGTGRKPAGWLRLK